ncbi:hypothetical protein J0X14_01130 [Muricauda sp. CAU 1633]|uniref:hypothetical protein n=1 Tax=Allomuricauda sp. CAU 1633 TaxID=2816036 RepID=UPI001A8C06FF|nr:hypothetical protein [Muricauda sp. CAU 1633]MBO0320883.1 hypothetical protein [Muricauda sp. CAU 1633]
MEDKDYLKLNSLADKGIVTKTTTETTGEIKVKKGNDIFRTIKNGYWKTESFFYEGEIIAQRTIIKFENGDIYEDRLSLYDGYSKVKSIK